MNLDNQTLMILGLVVLAVLNVPWSYLWSLAKSFKMPSFGRSADDELLIVSLKEVKKELHCISRLGRRLFCFAMNNIINGDLQLKWIGSDPRDGDLYRLLVTLHVQFGGFVDITIPGHADNGYVTNGASIPRWLWRVAGHPMTGQYQLAATVHDYFCTEAKRQNSFGLRNIGDAVFRELLHQSEVPEWKCRAMYAAVRLAGWWSFLGGKR